MLKKKKLFVLIIAMVLIISSFTMVGCVDKKDSTKKEHDAAGLPLTKASALKLWQGDWGVKDQYENINYRLRNAINNNQYLIFARIDEIEEGKNLDSYHNTYAKAEVKYDIQTKKLLMIRTIEGISVVDTFHFIEKNKLIHSDNVTMGETICYKKQNT